MGMITCICVNPCLLDKKCTYRMSERYLCRLGFWQWNMWMISFCSTILWEKLHHLRICLKVYNISIKITSLKMFISNLHHLIIFWPDDPQRFGCLERQSEQHRLPIVKINTLVAWMLANSYWWICQGFRLYCEDYDRITSDWIQCSL